MLCTHETTSSASLVLKFVLQFNNSYLNQFSSISGGNCITLMITYIKHLRYSAKAKHFLDHSTTSRLILKTMMSGVSQHLRRKYTSKHPPSLDLLPHQDPWQPHRHLNPSSPLPTSKRDIKGCKCLSHLQE